MRLHRVVDQLADGRLLGLALQMRPARLRRHPEDVLRRGTRPGLRGRRPGPSRPASLACCSSKASEMYLRKIRPRTTCLYSAASMLPRSASAICQSCGLVADVGGGGAGFLAGRLLRALAACCHERLRKDRGGGLRSPAAGCLDHPTSPARGRWLCIAGCGDLRRRILRVPLSSWLAGELPTTRTARSGALPQPSSPSRFIIFCSDCRGTPSFSAARVLLPVSARAALDHAPLQRVDRARERDVAAEEFRRRRSSAGWRRGCPRRACSTLMASTSPARATARSTSFSSSRTLPLHS